MTIGEMAKSMLLKLEWFDTRFPRIPVNVQVKYFLVYKPPPSTTTLVLYILSLVPDIDVGNDFLT